MRNVIVIPARHNSSRFPGKVLADLCGKPVVQHVFEQCLKSSKAEKVIIATDSELVKKACEGFGADVVMTCDSHTSGTSRIAEVIDGQGYENVVNIQGDEPFTSPKLIDDLFGGLEAGYDMVTAYHEIESEEELNNPNIVKVVKSISGEAIYFSRSPIPYMRPPMTFKDLDFYRHIGVYGYKSEFLTAYANMPASVLEEAEQLEQLRVVTAGKPIKMVLAEELTIGIDTPEDLDLAIKKLG